MSKKKLVLANNPLFSGPALSDREKVGIPYRVLPLVSIDRDPNQPRREFDEGKLSELANSIKTYGVLSPVLVKPSELPGRFTLISGERRYRASQIAGLDSIPVIVDQRDGNAKDTTLAMQLVENLQRADLSPLERAHAIGALRDSHSLSVRDIADKLGVSKSMVQRSLEILEFPDDLLNALRAGAPESKIALLAEIDDPEIRASYLKDIDALTRSQLARNIKKDTEGNDHGDSVLSAEDRRIAEEIQLALGLKVRMSRSAPNAESGKIVIEFYSSQDRQEIFRKLVSEGAN